MCKICEDIEVRYETRILEIGVDKDHVHFLLQSMPMYSPTKITQLINKNGYLMLSDFLDSQEEDVKKAFEKIGFKAKKILYKNCWVIYSVRIYGSRLFNLTFLTYLDMVLIL